jgi:peptide-methionine (S)-S-oxide reductase
MRNRSAFTAVLVLAFVSVVAFFCSQRARADQTAPGAAPNAKPASGKVEVATFAGGCFWGIQDKFDHVKGVLRTTAGYTGGTVKNPTYEQVCSHTTGHAEAVQVEFDPATVTYAQLLDLFWKIHNPRQVGGQGPDIGDNYRSVIFYHTPEQKAAAEASKAELNAGGGPDGSIVTQISPVQEFYAAEDYHQHYFKKQGILYPRCQ